MSLHDRTIRRQHAPLLASRAAADVERPRGVATSAKQCGAGAPLNNRRRGEAPAIMSRDNESERARRPDSMKRVPPPPLTGHAGTLGRETLLHFALEVECGQRLAEGRGRRDETPGVITCDDEGRR